MHIIAIKPHEFLFPHFQKKSKSEGNLNNISLSNQPVTMNLNLAYAPSFFIEIFSSNEKHFLL